MDQNQGVSVDTGKIKDFKPIEGLQALFVVPQEPYAFVTPVVGLATVVRQSQDYVEAMIPQTGVAPLQFVSFVEPPTYFYTYLHKETIGQQRYDAALAQAQQIGFNLAQQRSQYDPVTAESDPIPEPEPVTEEVETTIDDITAQIDAEQEREPHDPTSN